MFTKRPYLLAVPPLMLLAVLLMSWGGRASAGSPADDATEVERQVLQSTNPVSAPGQTLSLMRVVVPAGMELAPHTHPGPQLAIVVEGTLTYTVIDGQAMVTHAAGTDHAANQPISNGQTVGVFTGDSIMETMGMVHRAKNNGTTPVVIYLSTLFPEGAPASSPAP